MIAVDFTLLFVVFLMAGTNGKRFRTPCLESNRFRCDNGDCISKHNWCDGSRHCNDGSDETYCPSRYSLYGERHECDDTIHFSCKTSSMCIPFEGYCDGYSSCPDKSDEDNCPCEELFEEEENFEYEAFIGGYRTQQKCWKIAVNKGQQYLEFKIEANFFFRDCSLGNITIVEVKKQNDFAGFESDGFDNEWNFEDGIYESNNLICPFSSSPHRTSAPRRRVFSFYDDILIRYRSNFYSSGSSADIKDFFNITYKKVDMMCKEPEAFKCTKNSCISPEKQCDGNLDCKNGLDEQNCDYSALTAAYLANNRKKAVEWIKNQHNADWGWKENTHRAVVALYLAQGANYNGSSKEDDLIAKQLELEVSTHLLRSKSEKISATEMSAYINALLVICHDPRNFYGFDLINSLKGELDISSSGYAPPFPYLALCNAKEPISEDAVDRLLEILKTSSPNHGFVLELQALATMALSCIINNENSYDHLKKNISETLNNLKKEQLEDGSFGNKYTTALVLQALIANNHENMKDWSPKSSIQFLSKKQEKTGSFGDFLTTYLVMPILNAKSLVDVGKHNCTENLKRPRDGSLVSDIKSRLGEKMIVKYSLFIGDEKDQIHPIVLRTPKNITVFELMTLASDVDPKYKFKTHEIKKKKYVYEISNIPNDPENNKFWFIYQSFENGTVQISEQSPDMIKAHKQDHIIMWYKTLDSM